MAQELQSQLAQIATDANVRAVLLTGEGRAFCAGQDLDEVHPIKHPDLDLGKVVELSYNPLILAIRELEKPVVCVVNGVAAGAGANLTLACDIVVASEKATFIQSFCQVGLIPDSGGTYVLPRLIGLARARALCMLGEKVSAAEALAIGMIAKVYVDAQALPKGMALAKQLATQPTKGLALMKRAFNESMTNSLSAQLDLEAELQRQAGRSNDYVEGVLAFSEKRPPQFKGC
jgi:2-(1,2-epoxy-1,2-dihydrophenyl)acetyl-CoA isomerase